MATITKQTLFNNAVMAYMAECTGGKLKKFCEVMTQEGGDTIVFNRVKASTGDGRLQSMYSANPTDGGDLKEIKVTIDYVAEQQKIADADMKRTKIDVKNVYVKSLTNGVLRNEDKKIIEAIADSTPQAGGSETAANKVQITTDYANTATVKLVIKEIKRAQALASNTPDNHRGVALVMTAKDWSDLATSDYVLNQDYAVQYGGSNGAPDTFYGAEVVIVDEIASKMGHTNHYAYLIPSNTICWGEWEGSTKGFAEFHPTDGMSWHLQVVKSMGVKLAEPKSITQFTTV